MASLPSNLFTGGAVVFDTQPYVNFYAQMMARKQAKDEALDQTYQNFFKTVNPAGTRTQDIPLITQKTDEWQKFYQQNRDAIKNPRLDGGRAQAEFNSRYQDTLNTVQQSKNEAKKVEPLMKLFADPEKRSRIPESVIQGYALHEKPLNDPDRKTFDFNSLTFDPKPFDVTMQKNYLQGVQQGLKMDEAITGVKTNPDFTQTVTTTSSLGDEAKGAIRNRSAGAYHSDPSFKHFIDNELSQPQNYDRYNQIFKKNFGADIKNPEDLATAYTLGSIQDEQVEQKRQDDWLARQKFLQNQRIDLLNRRQAAEAGTEKEKTGWINEFLDNETERALSRPAAPYTYANGVKVMEYHIPVDPTLAKVLEKDKKQPVLVSYNPKDGMYRPIYPKYETVIEKNSQGKDIEVERAIRDKNGVFVVDDVLSKPISRQQLVLALGGRVTPTQRTVEMKESVNRTKKQQSSSTDKKNKYPLPAGKPRVIRQNGYEYIWNEATGTYE